MSDVLAIWAQWFKGPLALNPGLNLTRVFFFLCSKAFSRIIFSEIFRTSNHQLVSKRIKSKMLFKLSNLNSYLALTLGYLNPALNNSALFDSHVNGILGHQTLLKTFQKRSPDYMWTDENGVFRIRCCHISYTTYTTRAL